jgi:PEGA domain-containing protein
MIERRLVFVLALVATCGWWAVASAQSTNYVTGDSATLTVDVRPLNAQVKLDGVSIGTGHDLGARALAMFPGDHVVEVSADGYLTSVVQVPGTSNWATRVQLQLVPDRR